ncbi:MAG: branched-chain amino acid ABC transporter substrate-binding protein, partial [Longispora sp.]|nr:branched-chain amino acid ABC transporter substrate-binding protein [Longispora sp. (in: high G+C Gram-positive bacteria)]
MFAWIMAVSLSVVAVAACASPNGSGTSSCRGKLGILLPLRGPESEISVFVSIGNSVDLALAQFLEKNPQCKVELVKKEAYLGSIEEGVKSSRELIQDPDVIGVIDPIAQSSTSSASLEIGQMMSDAGLTTLLPTATIPKLSEYGWKTFHRTQANDIVQAAIAARYINNISRSKKVFTVYVGATYEELINELNKRVNLVGSAASEYGQTDFSSIVPQIVASGAEAVYFALYYEEAGALARQLRAAGSRAMFIGSDGLLTGSEDAHSPGYITSAGSSVAEGTAITCPCWPRERVGGNYLADYREKFKTDPNVYGPEAFDAANILLSGIKAEKNTRVDMEAFIDAYEGEGVTSKVKFTEKGENDPDLVSAWVYKVQNGRIVPDQQMY